MNGGRRNSSVMHAPIHYIDALFLTVRVLLKVTLSFMPVLPMLAVLAAALRLFPKR